MRAFGIQEPVRYPPVVRQYDEPVGILVEPADGEDAGNGDILGRELFRLVIGEIAIGLRLYASHFHHVSVIHLVAEHRHPAVDEYFLRFYEVIRTAAGRAALPREVLIDAHGMRHLPLFASLSFHTRTLHQTRRN